MEKKDIISIKEGLTEIYYSASDLESIPSKSMGVFYNPKMRLNRDISNLAINAFRELYGIDDLTIVDCMAASGISSIRILKECENIKKIYINDINPLAVDLINKNLELNDLVDSKIKIEVTRKDANLLFSELAQVNKNSQEERLDRPNVISIDPFGTPNLYIDSALKAIQRVNGLLCITATDTAVLFGVRPNACVRKYMSKPLRCEFSKEIGARILIHFISRVANINKLGIYPILTIYSSHFIRVFAATFKDKKEIINNFKAYGYIFYCRKCNYRAPFYENPIKIPKRCPECGNTDNLAYAGPLWINEIHNSEFVKRIIELNNNNKLSGYLKVDKILRYALDEITMPISYYDIHKLSKLLKLKNVPTMELIIEEIIKRGFHACRTHFEFTAIKTDIDLNGLKQILKELGN